MSLFSPKSCLMPLHFFPHTHTRLQFTCHSFPLQASSCLDFPLKKFFMPKIFSRSVLGSRFLPELPYTHVSVFLKKAFLCLNFSLKAFSSLKLSLEAFSRPNFLEKLSHAFLVLYFSSVSVLMAVFLQKHLYIVLSFSPRSVLVPGFI